MREVRIGTVDHYYGHLGVITIRLEDDLKVGDTIHVRGHTTDFTQKVESIQIGHKPVEAAHRGEGVGLRVGNHGRTHDAIFKVVEE